MNLYYKSFRIFIFGLATVIPNNLVAQESHYITDAFGLVPVSALQNTSRISWAGMREEITGGTSSIYVTAQAASKPEAVLLFVGPKSPVAGKDDVHAVSIVLDKNGNLAPNNTETVFALSSERRFLTDTRFGIASELFLPNPRSGLIHVGAASGSRQSLRGEFRVVPDLASVNLELVKPNKPFLREAFAEVSTDDLSDQFGNPVGHGVNIQLLGAMRGGGYTKASGLTGANSANIRLLTRAMGAQGQFMATLTNKKSAPITFKTATLYAPKAPKVQAVALGGIGTFQLNIGPFLSNTGYLLNDGSQINVYANFPDDRSIKLNGWLLDGYLEILIPGDANSLPIDLTVHAKTGVFRHRLEQFVDTLERPLRGAE